MDPCEKWNWAILHIYLCVSEIALAHWKEYVERNMMIAEWSQSNKDTSCSHPSKLMNVLSPIESKSKQCVHICSQVRKCALAHVQLWQGQMQDLNNGLDSKKVELMKYSVSQPPPDKKRIKQGWLYMSQTGPRTIVSLLTHDQLVSPATGGLSWGNYTLGSCTGWHKP